MKMEVPGKEELNRGGASLGVWAARCYTAGMQKGDSVNACLRDPLPPHAVRSAVLVLLAPSSPRTPAVGASNKAGGEGGPSLSR